MTNEEKKQYELIIKTIREIREEISKMLEERNEIV